jgi:hypothetical protein
MNRRILILVLSMTAFSSVTVFLFWSPKNEPPSVEVANGTDRLIGKPVRISLFPQPYFISCGVPLPPGTREVEVDREVYYAVLDSIGEEWVFVRPLDGLPKHISESRNYATKSGFPRGSVESISPLAADLVASRVESINLAHREFDDLDLGFDWLLNHATEVTQPSQNKD